MGVKTGKAATKSAPPPSERFLRGRRKRGQPARRIGRLLLRSVTLVLVLVSLATALVWTVSAFSQAPELMVHRVLVDGNEQLSDGEILELLDFSERANILMLDLEEVRSKLLRSAWVREVDVERILPATLKLEIHERQPVAVAVLDELYLLASDGTMLDQLSPHYAIEELVLVRGLGSGEGVISDRAALAGRLAEDLVSDERLSMLVSEVDVSGGPHSVELRLREPTVSVLVDGDTMVERLTEVVPLLGGIHERYTDVEVVDLRFEGRAYLRLKDEIESTTSAGGDRYARAAFRSGGAPF